jgi:GT2 family glycosyltransferase
VLIDDDSPDQTADAVRARFDWVVVIEHRGTPLYWCRAMHVALEHAAAVGYGYYLLLNDDTVLEPDAVGRLLACEAEVRADRDAPVIVAGSTNDGATERPSYGGERRISKWRKTTFRRVLPADRPQLIETFDGNVVLITDDALGIVGSLDPVFEHAMGDLDLGLRATSIGVAIWLAPGTHGACRSNPKKGTFHDRTLSLPKRWKLMLHQKGLPWRSWLHFTRRHAGIVWPVFFVWPYVRLIVDGLSSDGLRILRRARRLT